MSAAMVWVTAVSLLCKNGLEASLLAFVPLNDSCEVNQIKLTNKSSEKKSFTLFSYVEFCLWNAMDDMTNYPA